MMVGGGIGTIVIALLAYFLGFDPGIVTDQAPPPQADSRRGVEQTADPAQDSLAQFVSVVLAETEDVWHEIFRQEGEQYREPTLVLFSQQVQSACGIAGAAVGPFYCPRDGDVYIDLSFYRQLRERFGAPGDFAQAYVIAHEVGHHVQNLLGISSKVQRMQQAARSQAEANEMSVRLELQADFFAGLWAHYAAKKGILDPGDIEEALNAASAIGDDRLQEQAQGHVVPDSFTHGTSEQRRRWFRKGFETGDIRQGDTFAEDNL
jgi:predicted metalloprotease